MPYNCIHQPQFRDRKSVKKFVKKIQIRMETKMMCNSLIVQNWHIVNIHQLSILDLLQVASLLK